MENRTYPPKKTLHFFEPVLEGLDIALGRTSFLGDFDVRALERVSDTVRAFAVGHRRAITTDLQ